MSTLATDDRKAAWAAFEQWASLQAGAPRDVASLIQDVDVSHDVVGLLSTELHGRRVVWTSVPAPTRSLVMSPPISIELIDAWSVEARPLRDRSNHVASCYECSGEKRGRCAACNGAGAITCAACGGQRQSYGYSANGAWRLLNCTSCRGKGQVDCANCPLITLRTAMTRDVAALERAARRRAS